MKELNDKILHLNEKLDDIYEARVEIEKEKIYNKAVFELKE